MSECVVRMEMPHGCHDCKLRNMVGNCPIPMFDGQDEEKIWTLEECFQRPPWCPILCQLPEGEESPSPKPTGPVPIREVYYVMTECDVKTGTVTYELRERIEL